MPNWKKVITSGSDASLNTLVVSNGITGSLQGTSSWAENALTASYVNPLNQNIQITGSVFITGSNTVINSGLTTKTYQLVGNSYTASLSDYRIGVRYTNTGIVSIQLPLISQVGQIEYKFKDEDGNSNTNPITLYTSGSDLIDGTTTAVLKRDYISVGLYNDGVSNWYIE